MKRKPDLAARALAELNEKWWLDASASELASLDPRLPDSDESAKVVWARILRRRRLNLPHVDCTSRRKLFDFRWTRSATGTIESAPDCRCLTTALEELDASASKAGVLALSTKHHRAWLWKYARTRKQKAPVDAESAETARREPPRENVPAIAPAAPVSPLTETAGHPLALVDLGREAGGRAAS